MPKPAIAVSGIGKAYELGRLELNDRLGDLLWESLKSPLAIIGRKRRRGQVLWALRDVSFTVEEGEVVAIIGRNGAGKTTLLKILSRITDPSEGEVLLNGRIGSLLEVGTGFHPDLTGRENIFLNGAILGMRRQEIEKQFDAIVEFAETSDFLDTPVKRYSSGMYVRLAFSVAAHFEPEILAVDEVLAVGDAAFQRKSLRKMSDVARHGRTVLLVSHNMGILPQVADRAIWIDQGQVKFDGPVRDAIGEYLSSGAEHKPAVDLQTHPNRSPFMRTILVRGSTRLTDGNPVTDFNQLDQIVIELEYEAPSDVNLAGAGINLKTLDGVRVAGLNTYMLEPPPHRLPSRGTVRFVLESGQLTPGTYFVTPSVGIHPSSVEDMIENALTFTVHPSDVYGTGYVMTKAEGLMVLRANSSVKEVVEKQERSL